MRSRHKLLIFLGQAGRRSGAVFGLIVIKMVYIYGKRGGIETSLNKSKNADKKKETKDEQVGHTGVKTLAEGGISGGCSHAGDQGLK